MADVIMRPPLDLARPHGQQRLRPIERLDLTLFVHAQHQRPIRRVQVQAHDVADLLDKSGSFESLNVSVRCGCRANARQMRCTVLRLRPHAFASERVLQWVASGRGFQRLRQHSLHHAHP